ncbi:MAG TPA: AGE family epimerase/isomerase [Candidatus Sulfotelmatobacter sp.]|nr:AGE family epimerase/isomerase [Candidatus Sulfotelmatobacter sp.]
MNKNQLRRTYMELLLDGIVPFWARHGVDEKLGGVLSCMEEDGKPVSGDKYIWSQARWVWTCSALYNRIEKRPEFLKWAREAIDFLLRHGRDERGRWVYHTTREGNVVEGAISIYSDCFAVYGLSEYCRAVPDADLLALARKTFSSIQERVEAPEFAETAPYKLPPNRRNHGVPMILTEVAGELARTTNDAAISQAADDYALRVMHHFVRPARKCLVEFLDRNYQEVPAPEGTFVMPGHAIESMWFVMRRAMARAGRNTIRGAAEVLRWHLENGWDSEYGGIFLGIDVEGHPPFLPNSETKLWWPHTEALYGLLLARELTKEPWCEGWFDQIYEWSFRHFLMPDVGEWRQRLDRAGKPMSAVVALPVKDPFHLPRALILSLELLR